MYKISWIRPVNVSDRPGTPIFDVGRRRLAASQSKIVSLPPALALRRGIASGMSARLRSPHPNPSPRRGSERRRAESREEPGIPGASRFQLFAALLLAGCAVPREAGFPEVAQAVEQRTGHRIFWNQGGEADAAVLAKVREMLGSELSRAVAVQIALLNNRGLQAIYEELMIAQADVVQAGLLKNPVFSASIRFPTSGAVLGRSGDLGVALDFLDVVMIPAKKRLATRAFEAARLRVGDEVLRVAHETRGAYYACQGAQQIAAMRRTIATAAEASIELARRQHEAGNISDLDLASEEGLYEQVRLDVARSEAEILAARERLTRLMGLSGEELSWKLAPRLPDLPAADPPLGELEALALAQRLDVAAARADVEVRAAALAMAKDFRFLGGAGVGAGLERDPEGTTVAGPSVSLELPIFDQKQAAIARLVAQHRQAGMRLGALSVAARSEVREAHGRLAFARSVAERYRTTVIPLRERIVALSQRHHDAMLLGIHQVLLAKQAEVNAYREYIEAVRDYWIARSELERSLGGRLAQEKRP
jgi:cobalt-zinc-cadmium efflux system outer membrane protein